MAPQTSQILIELKLNNLEGIDKLKSAFRELDRTLGVSNTTIETARQRINEYIAGTTRSEQAINGQLAALRGLRSQVDINGRSYQELTTEINQLQGELRGSTDAVDRQREALLRNAGAGKQNAEALQRQITNLERLRQQTRPGSSAFLQLGQDIEKATASLGRFRSEVSQAASTVTQIPGSTFEKIANQVSILQRRMQTLNFTSADFLRYQERINLVNLVQSTIVGRQQVRANAALYASPQYTQFVGARAEKTPLPSTPAGYQQRIGEIQAELENITNLERRRELTVELDGLNRRLAGTVSTVVTAEQRAVDAVRARVNAQRELLAQSGFGSFSASISRQDFKAVQQRNTINDVQTAFSSIRQAQETMEMAMQAASRRTVDQELNAAKIIEDSDQRIHAARMERKQQEFQAEINTFDAVLRSRGIESAIEKRRRTLQGEIGIPTTRDLSPFYENVVGLGTTLPRRSQQFMGRAPQQVLGDIMYQASSGKILDPVNQDLKTFNTLTTLSTTSIGELSTALNTLKANLRPTDAGYKQLNASIERNEKIIESTLRKRQSTQRQSLGGRQIAQIGGAAISGGIFGGPEGFLGGVIGGAVGGVGGSFAGAAAGAQLGMLRQQLGQTSAYAAEIGKMQIALRGVSGSQANYNQALAAAARLTAELNIPQREATTGITRLSAAVLGAGGTMTDATFAFRAITESIKATGGNAEQVDGALLALTQVFSKGKVSAEELNQIAERLPGTFTLFAQATGKTGPELQKALQQGTVGLNDLMKFLDLASSKNAATALAMSKSSEDAGARMTIAFQRMALEVGKVLQPIGAQFQNAFADFAKQATPGVIETTKSVGGLLKVILDNGAAIAALTKLALQFGAATLAIKAFTALQGPLTIAMQAIALQFGALSQQTVAAEARLRAFALTAKATAASLAAPIILTIAIVGADLVMQRLNEIDEAQKNIGKIRRDISAPEWLKRAGGTALTKQDLTGLASNLASELDKANEVLRPLMQTYLDPEKTLYGQVVETDTKAIRKDLEAIRAKGPLEASIGMKAFALQMLEAMDRVDQLNARYQEVIKALPSAPTQRRTAGGGFPAPAGDTETQAARDKKAADEQRKLEELAKAETDYNIKIYENGIALDRKRYELRKQLLDEEQQNELARLQGTARTTAQAIFAYRNKLAEIDRGIVEARSAVGMETVRAQAAQAIASAGGSRNYANIGGIQGGRQMLHGIPGFAGYDRAHATPSNIHYHFAGKSPEETLAVATYLKQQGYNITEFGGMGQRVGGHAPGSQHYRNNAFDIGGASLGQSDAQIQAGMRLLHKRINDFLAISTVPTPGRPRAADVRRGIRQQGRVGTTTAEVSGATDILNALLEAAPEQRATAGTTALLSITENIRASNYELGRNLELETARQKLLQSGASQAYIDQQMKLLENRREQAVVEATINEYMDPAKKLEAIAAVTTVYEEQRRTLEAIYQLNQANANTFGFREGAQRYVESIGTMREATASLTEQGFKGLEDVIFQLTTTGTANFQQFAASILQQTARMIIQQLILKTIMQALGAIGGGGGGGLGNYGVNLGMGFNQIPSFPTGSALPSFAGFAGMAKGGVLAANGIVPYAMGGIVTRPTLFPFANGGSIGTGLMGEAGPEAIIPLQRGANGKLGVAGGGGTTNIVVNVDASGGTSVSGDEAQAKQLGQVVTAAVQAELIKQRRPGGLLSR